MRCHTPNALCLASSFLNAAATQAAEPTRVEGAQLLSQSDNLTTEPAGNNRATRTSKITKRSHL